MAGEETLYVRPEHEFSNTGYRVDRPSGNSLNVTLSDEKEAYLIEAGDLDGNIDGHKFKICLSRTSAQILSSMITHIEQVEFEQSSEESGKLTIRCSAVINDSLEGQNDEQA